jgi:hypothetical protein
MGTKLKNGELNYIGRYAQEILPICQRLKIFSNSDIKKHLTNKDLHQSLISMVLRSLKKQKIIRPLGRTKANFFWQISEQKNHGDNDEIK